MYILNQSAKVHHSVEERFLQWVDTYYSPTMLSTTILQQHRICRLLHPQDEDEYQIYIIQWIYDKEQEQEDIDAIISKLGTEIYNEYNTSVLAFCSVMEILHKQ